MLNVLKMDLILNRVALIANLVIMAGFMAFMASWEEGAPPRVYALFTGMMMAFLPVMIVTREDKFKAMALGCSLPVTRETIVRARYLLAVGGAAAGVAFSFGLALAVPTSQLAARDLLQPGTVLMAFSVTTFVLSILLPFTLRFGAFGLILVLAGFQVLGIVGLTLAKFTRSSADRRLIDGLVGGVRNLYSQLGAPGFYLLLVLLLVLVLSASYAVSVWIFRKREL